MILQYLKRETGETLCSFLPTSISAICPIQLAKSTNYVLVNIPNFYLKKSPKAGSEDTPPISFNFLVGFLSKPSFVDLIALVIACLFL